MDMGRTADSICRLRLHLAAGVLQPRVELRSQRSTGSRGRRTDQGQNGVPTSARQASGSKRVQSPGLRWLRQLHPGLKDSGVRALRATLR